MGIHKEVQGDEDCLEKTNKDDSTVKALIEWQMRVVKEQQQWRHGAEQQHLDEWKRVAWRHHYFYSSSSCWCSTQIIFQSSRAHRSFFHAAPNGS